MKSLSGLIQAPDHLWCDKTTGATEDLVRVMYYYMYFKYVLAFLYLHYSKPIQVQFHLMN